MRCARWRVLLFLRNLRDGFDFESISGDLRVEGGRPEEVVATTVSGNLFFLASARRVRARAVSGTVRVEREVDDLVVRTGDGAVELFARIVGEARLESVSGRVQVKAAMAEEGRLRVFVHEGQAELALPSDLAAKFRLETTRGTLESEFGPPLNTPQKGRKQVVIFRTGAGHARVEARSISGSLRLLAHRF